MSVMQVGIPTNEKLYPMVERLLNKAGIDLKPNPKRFFSEQDGVRFVFARVSELARLVARHKLDCAFVTTDYWLDLKDAGLGRWQDGRIGLPGIKKSFPTYCQCEISFVSQGYWYAQGVAEGGITNALIGFIGVMRRSPRIATRFPFITEGFLCSKMGLKTPVLQEKLGERWSPAMQYTLREVDGSEELHVLLGATDFAVVQIETGETIANHDLHVVENLLKSHLLLVGNNPEHSDLPLFTYDLH